MLKDLQNCFVQTQTKHAFIFPSSKLFGSDVVPDFIVTDTQAVWKLEPFYTDYVDEDRVSVWIFTLNTQRNGAQKDLEFKILTNITSTCGVC